MELETIKAEVTKKDEERRLAIVEFLKEQGVDNFFLSFYEGSEPDLLTEIRHQFGERDMAGSIIIAADKLHPQAREIVIQEIANRMNPEGMPRQ